MSFLLFGAGAVALMAGVAMVGFGIPINEFSFGNTLIIAGTTAAVGGLIVIGLGAAVSQLRQIVEALGTRAAVRPTRPVDMFEPGAGLRAAAAPSRVPFPQRQTPAQKSDFGAEPHRAELRSAAPMPAGVPLQGRAPESAAPTLANPDEPPVTVEDEVSLSPRHPMSPPVTSPAPTPVDFDEPTAQDRPAHDDEPPALDETPDEPPALDVDWPAPTPAAVPPPAQPVQSRKPQATYFDSMWPAQPKPAKTPPTHDDTAEPAFDRPPLEAAAAPAESDESAQQAEEAPATAAILKSGVVDGMGYTLYVDGSIEAELPNGTLRFASINELRSHLEQAS